MRRSTKDTRNVLVRDDIGAKEWVTLIYEQSKLNAFLLSALS